MQIASYSFKDVTMLVDGTPVTGYADGDSLIRIARNVPPWSLSVGGAGDVVALQSGDRSGTAVFQLQQTSEANAFLTGKLKIQDAGQLSPFPFVLKDPNGLDLVLAEAAFVEGPPEMVFGDGHNMREWTLLLPAVDLFAMGVA